MLQQRTPMNRGKGFARKVYVPPPAPPIRPATRKGVISRIPDVGNPMSKDKPVRSEEYRRLVAVLPCKVCGIVGHGQAAHPNTGKGQGTKTDDRLCFCLCADRPGVCGCHPQFDQGVLFTKAVRRELEPVWGADTRRHILAAGLWPKRLPHWDDSTKGEKP